MFSKRQLTDLLLTTIADSTEFPCGDAHTPGGNFGWSGQPGESGSVFTPYTILTPQPSSGSSGPISDPQADWKCSYGITSFGTSREQCEWIADLARSSFYGLKRTTFEGIDSTYTIQQVRIDTIGGIQRTDAIEPPIFGQTDVFTVWSTKSA